MVGCPVQKLCSNVMHTYLILLNAWKLIIAEQLKRIYSNVRVLYIIHLILRSTGGFYVKIIFQTGTGLLLKIKQLLLYVIS